MKRPGLSGKYDYVEQRFRRRSQRLRPGVRHDRPAGVPLPNPPKRFFSDQRFFFPRLNREESGVMIRRCLLCWEKFVGNSGIWRPLESIPGTERLRCRLQV